MSELLKVLCETHTSLVNEDILILQHLAKTSSAYSDLIGADLFIDCLCSDRQRSIVVMHRMPYGASSLYDRIVTGEFAEKDRESAVYHSLVYGMPFRDVRAITQEKKSVKQFIHPVKNAAGKTIAALIAEVDITEDEKQKDKLSQFAEDTAHLLGSHTYERGIPIGQYSSEAILLFSSEGVCLYANSRADSLYHSLGIPDRLTGKQFDELSLDRESIQTFLERGPYDLSELKVGQRSIRRSLTRASEQILVMNVQDVTEQREKERKLVLRSTVNSEIHHRVKNNLQTVASLLQLQRRRIEDPKARDAFEESIARVIGMASLHELLSESEEEEVEILSMMRMLTEELNSRALLRPCICQIEGQSVKLGSDKASTLALVITELLQNSSKHTPEDREDSCVTISVLSGQSRCSVRVSDQSGGYDLNQPVQGLGTRILETLVTERLEGTVRREREEHGTVVTIEFDPC